MAHLRSTKAFVLPISPLTRTREKFTSLYTYLPHKNHTTNIQKKPPESLAHEIKIENSTCKDNSGLKAMLVSTMKLSSPGQLCL
jgi:hypothetical protein